MYYKNALLNLLIGLFEKAIDVCIPVHARTTNDPTCELHTKIFQGL